MRTLSQPRSADLRHVPYLEHWAENQRPKTADHRDAKLYRIEETNLYQWYSKVGSSVFEDPFGEPFVIEPVNGLDMDHRQRAMVFHRRAQRAEADEQKASEAALHWRRAFRDLIASKRTLKRRLNRARARLRGARWADPLTRIIELGRLFP